MNFERKSRVYEHGGYIVCEHGGNIACVNMVAIESV